MLRRIATITILGFSALAAANACSSEQQSSSTIDPNATGSGGSGTGGSSGTNTGGSSATGAGAVGGAAPTGGTGGGLFVDAAGGAGGLPFFGDACALEKEETRAEPVDIYIMLDQSTSMGPTENNVWVPVTSALKYFIGLPESSGIRVGIQYFGLPGADDRGHSCNPADYANPDVGIAELPGNAAALIASIDRHAPSTLTPTRPALEGALNYARTWATANPDRTTVVVLATDGFPTVCNTDLNQMQDLARAAATGTPRILTFVVGIGGDQNLTNLAKAGGTGAPFIVETGVNTEQQFAQAMRSIAATPLACDYEIPRPGDGGATNNLVNLIYTAPGTPPDIIYGVGSPTNCSPTTKGWYFDNATTPTRIFLCPETCNGLGAGSIEIYVGCATEGGPT